MRALVPNGPPVSTSGVAVSTSGVSTSGVDTVTTGGVEPSELTILNMGRGIYVFRSVSLAANRCLEFYSLCWDVGWYW